MIDLPLQAQNVGQRVITFDNGRHEDVFAVAVNHEPTHERWEQIWVLRSSAMADRVAAALNAVDSEGRGLATLRQILDLCAHTGGETAKGSGVCDGELCANCMAGAAIEDIESRAALPHGQPARTLAANLLARATEPDGRE